MNQDRRTIPQNSFRIDGGTITTDPITLYKLIEFCIKNNIVMEFVNGSLNTTIRSE